MAHAGPRPVRPFVFVLATTVSMAVLCLVTGRTNALAQTSPAGTSPAASNTINAPFPGEVVAPIPSLSKQPGADAPELMLADFYVAPSVDSEAPDVVVQFAAPFTLPSASYRVSVVVGNPDGERLRVSLVSKTARQAPTGLIERWDGSAWQDGGPTSVTFNPSGFAVLRVPHATAPPGGAVWVELNEGNMATATRTSPYYSRPSFFGVATEGTLPGGTVARVNEGNGNLTSAVVTLADAPVVTWHDGVIDLRTAVPPTTLLDQPVRRVTDTIRIVPNYNQGATGSFDVIVDWSARSIALINTRAQPAADVTGDRSWVRTGFSEPLAGMAPGSTAGTGGESLGTAFVTPPQQLTSPLTFSFDVATIANVVGVDLDPATMGAGSTRTFGLGDGRVVTADGVLATNTWFTRTPVQLEELPTTSVATAPDATTGSESAPVSVLAVLCLAFVVAAALALIVKLDRRRWSASVDAPAVAGADERHIDEDRVPWARNDSAFTATAEMERIRIATGVVPVVRVDETPAPMRVETLRGPDPAPIGSDAPAPDAVDEVAAIEDADADRPAPLPGVDPHEVLAALDLDLGGFKTRLDELDRSEPG